MCMRCGKHTPVECPEGGPAAELQRECCCRCREKRSWRKALRLKLVIFLIRQRGGKLPPFDRRLHALTESAPHQETGRNASSATSHTFCSKKGLPMNDEVDRLLAVYSQNFPAYENQEERLEREHYGKFAVFRDGQLLGVYETVEDAEEDRRLSDECAHRQAALQVRRRDGYVVGAICLCRALTTASIRRRTVASRSS